MGHVGVVAYSIYWVSEGSSVGSLYYYFVWVEYMLDGRVCLRSLLACCIIVEHTGALQMGWQGSRL